METHALHPLFGLEVRQVDLRSVARGQDFPTIRRLFDTHSLLLFRNQQLDDAHHLRLAGLFGAIENRESGRWGVVPERPGPVSNRDAQGELVDESDAHLKHLQANQLWHTDSTFLPVPALANLLAARKLPSRGGETQFATTRAAFQQMPAPMREKAREAVVLHRYAHSRAQIDPALSRQALFTMWPDQAWRAVWPNPATGEEALYIASHAYAVEGRSAESGQALIREWLDWATRDCYVYTHNWRPGDVLIWDERATLHRGRPWPYDEERTLASLCVSAGEADGLEAVRP